MTVTELLGRLARAKDRLSMGQKSVGLVFQYLVGRSDWDYETANGLRDEQQRLPRQETLDEAIVRLEEAVHDLKIVRDEVTEQARRHKAWLTEGQPKQ